MAEQQIQKTKPGKAENRRATHRMIVDAARRVLQRDGTKAVSTENIAVESGLKPNIVKERFRSSDELLLGVAASELATVSRVVRDGSAEALEWLEKSGEALDRVQTITRALDQPDDGESVGALTHSIRALGKRQTDAASDLVTALQSASHHLAALDDLPPLENPTHHIDAAPPSAKTPSGPNAFLASARQAAKEAASTATHKPHLPRASRKGKTILLACIAPVAIVAAGFLMFNASTGTPLPAPKAVKPAAASLAIEISPELTRLMQTAQSGDAKAQTLLGLKYLDGEGVAADDTKALHWLQRAAEQGQPIAQYRLGNLYAPHDSVLFNPIEAGRWYQAAAAQGNLQAMNNIAFSYAEGSGVEKNLAEAALWFSKAAELGFTIAQFNLAVLYERGEGVPQSRMNAYKWYAIAAMSGDMEAQARRDMLQRELTPSERVAAERAVQNFRTATPNAEANNTPVLADSLGG